jgi:hypothetical protein
MPGEDTDEDLAHHFPKTRGRPKLKFKFCPEQFIEEQSEKLKKAFTAIESEINRGEMKRADQTWNRVLTPCLSFIHSLFICYVSRGDKKKHPEKELELSVSMLKNICININKLASHLGMEDLYVDQEDPCTLSMLSGLFYKRIKKCEEFARI